MNLDIKVSCQIQKKGENDMITLMNPSTMYLDRHVWAKSVHCLPFFLHLLDVLLNNKATLDNYSNFSVFFFSPVFHSFFFFFCYIKELDISNLKQKIVFL